MNRIPEEVMSKYSELLSNLSNLQFDMSVTQQMSKYFLLEQLLVIILTTLATFCVLVVSIRILYGVKYRKNSYKFCLNRSNAKKLFLFLLISSTIIQTIYISPKNFENRQEKIDEIQVSMQDINKQINQLELEYPDLIGLK